MTSSKAARVEYVPIGAEISLGLRAPSSPSIANGETLARDAELAGGSAVDFTLQQPQRILATSGPEHGHPRPHEAIDQTLDVRLAANETQIPVIHGCSADLDENLIFRGLRLCHLLELKNVWRAPALSSTRANGASSA